MQINLNRSLIFLTVSGSQAYGIATPTSDWDLRGVGVAPLGMYFGTRHWEQTQELDPYLLELLHQKHPHANDVESCVFNVKKFIQLAADANPNILDLLFAHPDDWLMAHELWEEVIYPRRHEFLSMKVRYTYTGYAMSQLKRIKSHRAWLLNPPKHKPTREEFGLPPHQSLVPKDVQDLANSMLHKKQQEWQLDRLMESISEDDRDELKYQISQMFEMVHGRPYNPDDSFERGQAAIQLGMDKDLYKRLEAERNYKQAMNHWKQFEEWKLNRNEKRAQLEADFGYDTKHATHLVRLLLSVEEILKEGDLSVRHPHADLLREIRGGAWDYDTLIGWAEEQEAKINELSASKPLPKTPNRDQIDNLVMEVIMRFNHAY